MNKIMGRLLIINYEHNRLYSKNVNYRITNLVRNSCQKISQTTCTCSLENRN